MNLSFAGCGFLGIYHVGVAVCFKKYAPHLLLHKISGASAGTLAACCLLCDMPLGEMTSDFFRVVNEARSHSLGPFSPSFNIQTCLFEGLQKFLPADAHERVNGKLHISLTRVYDGKNVIVSQFNSREDLLQALLCACFIPVFSGLLPPRFHGVRYMDGAFSDNLPTLDENTVTVSPFCGESDICPRDNSSQMFHVNWANTSIELSKQNMNRFGRILFPPKPEILSSFCQQGFDDALNFLHRNNLISCTRCLAVQSTFVVAEQFPIVDELEEYDPECSECKECTQHRKDALVGNMPDTVLTVFQTYIEQANKGLINWVFRHRGAKLLTALSLPATLPADIVCATLTKLILTANRFASIVGDTLERREFGFKVLANIVCYSSRIRVEEYAVVERDLRGIMLAAPTITDQIRSISKYLLDNLNIILLKIRRHQKMTANLSCQLAMTEYAQQHPHKHGHRSSKIDLRMDDGKSSVKDVAPNNHAHTPADVDAFEHILQVTSHQEAVYAYYYMDENNKVKVTEIFDMTDNENPNLQTANEREVNQQLEFDTDWETTQPDYLYPGDYYGSNMINIDEYIDPASLEEIFINNNNNNSSSIQWQYSEIQIDEIQSDASDTYLRPEADQQNTLMSDTTNLLLNKAPAYSIVEM